MTTAGTSPEEVARRALWELAAQSAGIGTYVLHLPNRVLVADDRILALSGVDPATFSGRPEDLYALIHPEDLPAVIAKVDATVATGRPYSAEYRVQLPDGSTRWVAARGQAVLAAKTCDSNDVAEASSSSRGVGGLGEVTALVGAAYDITALRQATARTNEVLETMSAAFYFLDRDWRFTYINGPAETLLGRARQEALGKVVWDLFPEARDSVIGQTYRAAAASGQPASFEAYYPAPLHTWFEIRVWPSTDGLSVFFLDITARRIAADAAERANRRLAAVSEVALALTAAEDVDGLVATMAERGLSALGADGGSVAVPDPADPTQLLSYITTNFGEVTRAEFGRVPLDAALPVSLAAKTGQRVLLADRAQSEALSSLVVAANAATGCQAWASVPLRAGEQVLGVLTAGWRDAQTFDVEQLDLLDTFAAQCAQALQRLAARDAERAAAAAAERAAAQQAALVSIAMALDEAGAEEQVLAVVTGQGAALLGAQGGVLCLSTPSPSPAASVAHAGATPKRRVVRALTTAFFNDQVQAEVSELPAGFPLPMVDTAITGTAHYFPDQASAVAAFPGAAQLYTAARTQASAAVPLRAEGALLGSLSLAFDHDHDWSTSDQDLLEAFATLTAQAVQRISSREAERAAGRAVARFSETLQRSLLTSPPEPDHLQIAVRYAPSAAEAQVGGDWYDAFLTPGGLTSLVIGDVTGHDQHAAAAMGQLRNLLRGIGHAIVQPPAAVLSALDAAVHDMDVGALATVVLAQVEQTPAQETAGLRTLRWSNAGHPPPLLITPGAPSRYLEADASTGTDLLLGLDPHTIRHDHEVVLEPGATVLMFTDGLVERRDTPLQAGLDWLLTATTDLANVAGLGLEELCDALLALVGERVEDDVALLAMRAHREDAPRPAEAGPRRDPLMDPTIASSDELNTPDNPTDVKGVDTSRGRVTPDGPTGSRSASGSAGAGGSGDEHRA